MPSIIYPLPSSQTVFRFLSLSQTITFTSNSCARETKFYHGAIGQQSQFQHVQAIVAKSIVGNVQLAKRLGARLFGE